MTDEPETENCVASASQSLNVWLVAATLDGKLFGVKHFPSAEYVFQQELQLGASEPDAQGRRWRTRTPIGVTVIIKAEKVDLVEHSDIPTTSAAPG